VIQAINLNRAIIFTMKPLLLLSGLTLALGSASAEELDFNREVRPILAANCFECHGPDEAARKGKLRLDQAGARALTDGEVIARIMSDDPDEIMPPPKANKTLSGEQIETLKAWIESGAEYAEHWAFVKPTRPDVPKRGEWARNEIDAFVARRLQKEGLEPSPEADPYSLIRRVYLDLIGLLPTQEEADAFVNSEDPLAYEQLVDRLLNSPHYGERWARPWLDLARYADSNGYEKDRPRSIWPYRDWVIRALNADQPFDQFTIEQIAGDMLPNATLDQRIATGFHRNTMLNEEGGIDPLEYRFHAVVDRVLTTGTTWMGLTTGCAQCHTHKYDPITHTDYFGLFALLNNADEPDLEVWDEATRTRQAELETRIRQTEQELLAGANPEAVASWIQSEREKAVPWTVIVPTTWSTNLPKLEVEEDGAIFASGDFTKRDVYTLNFELEDSKPITAIRLEVLPDSRLPARGPGRSYYEGRDGDFFLSELTLRVGGMPVSFASSSAGFGKIAVGSGGAKSENVYDGKGSTGWSTATREGERHELVLNLAEPIANPSSFEIELLFERHFVAALGKFRFAVTSSPKPAQARPGMAADPLNASEAEMKLDYVRFAPEFETQREPLVNLRKQLPKPATTLVFRERPTDNIRPTFRHHRGEYLQAKEPVSPRVPEMFEPIPDGEPVNRLSFAQWLVSDRNPLVARVTVNRAWQQMFGRGIVESTADFGTQSAPPSHPELLDWLAVDFVENGWSFKKLHRLIVTSATYRQSSRITPSLLEKDPDNSLLARGARFRLDAEAIRDVGLKASGLLSPKMFGPSVFPVQDSSVYAAAYGKPKWQASKGADQYRRSLYTFSKRTAPFAAFTVFDAPTGETCTARRERSNTPLQALTLLNDQMFVEMAEGLARDAITHHSDSRERVQFMLRRCLTRPPTEFEVATLLTFQEEQQRRLNDESLAWMLTARAVINLDETITKG
tara:strand:+ start:5052 stop:7943 length:2892 start_codon:yes stop_codon:yes gene_type:complete